MSYWDTPGGKVFYADTAAKVDKVVAACIRFQASHPDSPVGLDTEFTGVEIGRESTVARSKLAFLSLAVPRLPLEITPRGYHRADAAVVPGGIVRESDALSRYLAGPYRKAVHNLPVDAHTISNLPGGITLGGGVNTLDLARFAWPERARGAGFTLDALGTDFLGEGKSEAFSDLFSETRTETTYKTKSITRCECGAVPCRKRTTTPGHARIQHLQPVTKEKVVEYEVPVDYYPPDHPKFPRVLAYSARDALLALWIYEVAMFTLARTTREMPW